MFITLPVISAPPSSVGCFHSKVHRSANTSLTLKFLGASGLSEIFTENQKQNLMNFAFLSIFFYFFNFPNYHNENHYNGLAKSVQFYRAKSQYIFQCNKLIRFYRASHENASHHTILFSGHKQELSCHIDTS